MVDGHSQKRVHHEAGIRCGYRAPSSLRSIVTSNSLAWGHTQISDDDICAVDVAALLIMGVTTMETLLCTARTRTSPKPSDMLNFMAVLRGGCRIEKAHRTLKHVK